MSIKRTLRQPREHLSDDFWKTILSHTLDESEARLKDGLDRIHGLQPNQFINGGFRQFASVPRSKLESANPKLWESAKVQKLVIDTWIESALEVRTRSFDYFTVLGYLIPEEAFGNDYYSSTIAEHVIRSDHGQVQIICDERWPYLDSDTITAVALAYGLIPNLETHDESSPSISIAHIPTRIQSLSGRAANLRARYAEGFDDVWPDDVVIPTGLIDSLQSISEEARKLWSEMASADADSAASMPETFSEFRSRWSERVNDAISRLNVAGIDRTTKESCFLEDFSRVNQSNDQASEIVSTILGLKDEFPNQFGAIDRACKSVFDAKGSIGFGDFVAPIAEESATLDVDFKALKDIFDLLVAAATNPEEPQAAMSSVDGGGMKTAAALDNATAVVLSHRIVKVHRKRRQRQSTQPLFYLSRMGSASSSTHPRRTPIVPLALMDWRGDLRALTSFVLANAFWRTTATAIHRLVNLSGACALQTWLRISRSVVLQGASRRCCTSR